MSEARIQDELKHCSSGYGQSGFYLGEEGRKYFERQGAAGIASGELEARKFATLIGKPGSVLDFGCGGGFLIEVLLRTVPVVCGVEPNPAARAECLRRGLDVRESLADLPNREFDVIVSNHCLEHVPYPIEALREMQRWLAPKGVLALALPIDDWRGHRSISSVDKDHHLHTWTPVLIRNTLSEAGYTTVSARVYTYAWPRAWQKLNRVLPTGVFDLLCVFWGAMARRRQLLVLARPRSDR